ncbi:MAG: glycosyltransferase family 2 protein [Candidatus Woesearchaeota archaeon]
MNDPLVSVVIPTYNRKEMLIRLIKSIKKSTYKNLEIIVVDDASTDGTYEEIKRKFPDVKIVRNEKNLMVSASRNIGIKFSKGDYIFLIDSDNIVDKDTIKILVETFKIYNNVGIVGPIMYYYYKPDIIWCAGVFRNMITGYTIIIGKDKKDVGQFKKILYSNDFPNAFMVKKNILKKSILFDDKNFPIHYEEADFCKKIKELGYKILMNPKAKVWHDIQNKYHFDKKRAFFLSRNRIIFIKKYGKIYEYIIFFLIFMNILNLFYIFVNFTSKRRLIEKIEFFKLYLEGIKEGIFWRSK